MGILDKFKKNNRELQLETIKSLNESFPEGWWLFGGWAIEAITGKSWPHNDIDLYVLEGTQIKKKGFLDVHVLHKKGNLYVDKRPEGTFYFSKKAFEKTSRSLHGIQVRTVSPEFLYIMAMNSPKKRQKEIETIQLLKDLVNPEKMKNIVRYTEKVTKKAKIKPKTGLLDRIKNALKFDQKIC